MTILTSDIVAWWSLTKKGSRIAPEALSTQILIRIRRSSLVVASGGGGGGGGGYVAITGDAAASAGGRMYGLSGGTPGQGSEGSHGSDGYAILYYGLIRKSPTGPLVTSEQKRLLDSLGRRIIV